MSQLSQATDKQIAFALSLLAKRGYSTRFMNAQFKELGATMKERSGLVEDWVRNLGKDGASKLIERLRA